MLVVGDDPALPDLLTEALTDEGYRVRRAKDGVVVPTEIRRAPPDLVLADVRLPRLDGWQLVRRRREWNVPVVPLSGDANRSGTPGIAFVPNPFALDHLLAADPPAD